LITAKAYVHFDNWTTENIVKYMILCNNSLL
jgi:hypothetical protein